MHPKLLTNETMDLNTLLDKFPFPIKYFSGEICFQPVYRERGIQTIPISEVRPVIRDLLQEVEDLKETITYLEEKLQDLEDLLDEGE